MIRADDRERLSADCARLSAEGLSLRAIGERMGFSYETARALIAERQTQTGVRGPHPARPPAPQRCRNQNQRGGTSSGYKGGGMSPNDHAVREAAFRAKKLDDEWTLAFAEGLLYRGLPPAPSDARTAAAMEDLLRAGEKIRRQLMGGGAA